MNVLVPMSTGGECTNEPQYSSTAWADLPGEKQAEAIKNIEIPQSGVCFEFTSDEVRRLRNEGRFNGPEIGGYAKQLLGIKTRTFVGKDGDTVIELLGEFRQDTSHPLENNTVVGTIFPRQLTSILDKILMKEPFQTNP